MYTTTTTEIRQSQFSEKSFMTHAGHVLVPRDLDFWHFDLKINGFPGLMVDHVYVKFSNRSYVAFWDIVWKNKHTDGDINAAQHQCDLS